jgi:hypothetical protein
MVSFSPIDIAITSTYKDKGAREAQNSLTKLSKSAFKLAGAFGVAFSVEKIVKFAKSSIPAFAQEQKSAKSLALTLGNLGMSFETLATEQFIARIQKTRGILDDELRPAMRQLVSTTFDASLSQDILLTALDLSAGAGIDLSTAVDALSKSYLGNNRALVGLNIGYSTALLKGKSFAEVQALLNKQFAGQGEASAAGAAGQMAILAASMDVAREIVGEGLVRAFEDLNINAQKTGSLMESVARKSVTAMGMVSKFIRGNLQFLNTPISDLLSDKSGSTFAYKMNFDKPYDPMSSNFNYEALRAEQKKQQAAAAKTAKDRLAAIKKEQDLLKKQQQLLKDQEKIKKYGSLFDTEQIEIFAALQGKVTEQEKLRLNLQLALLQGNASEAERLAKQLAIVQLQTTDLAGAIAKIPMALNPFKGWGSEIDNLLAKMIEMYRLLQMRPEEVISGKVRVPLSPTTAASVLANAPQASAEYASITGVMGDLGIKTPSINITINNAGSVVSDDDLVDQIRNGLLNSNLSGSASSVGRLLGAFQ